MTILLLLWCLSTVPFIDNLMLIWAIKPNLSISVFKAQLISRLSVSTQFNLTLTSLEKWNLLGSNSQVQTLWSFKTQEHPTIWVIYLSPIALKQRSDQIWIQIFSFKKYQTSWEYNIHAMCRILDHRKIKILLFKDNSVKRILLPNFHQIKKVLLGAGVKSILQSIIKDQVI